MTPSASRFSSARIVATAPTYLPARRPNVLAAALRDSLLVVATACVVSVVVAFLLYRETASPLADVGLPFLGTLLATVGVFSFVAREIGVWRARPPGQYLPPLGLGMAAGCWVWLILGPIPSIQDPSFLLFPEAASHYGEAYLFAGLAIAVYSVGVRVLPGNPQAEPAPSSTSYFRNVLMVFLMVVVSATWALRVYMASIGAFTGHGAEYGQLTGVPMYLFYGMLYLRLAIIPVAEYFRSQSRGSRRLFWGAMSWVELLARIAASEREAVVILIAQLLVARSYFSRWSLRRAVVSAAGLGLVFLVFVNPWIYITRDAMKSGEIGVGASMAAYVRLLGRTASQVSLPGTSEAVDESLERDVKYRLNSLYFIAAMMGADDQGVCEHGWGAYTLRNMATMIPGFVWPSKRATAISNIKLELPGRLGVPQVDYIQTLPTHWYADFGWYGFFFMVFAGIFDQLLFRSLISLRRSVTMALLYLVLLPTFLSPVEDFSGHFLGKFRETLPAFALLYLAERRRTWAGLRRAARATGSAT